MEPTITIRAVYSSFTSGDNAHPTRIVIHGTNSGQGFPTASRAGTALDTANYFAGKGGKQPGGSAHYIVDVATEVHCVPDNTVAFHAPPNERSIGIEICADGGDPKVAPTNYTLEQWTSPQCWPAVLRAAQRTAELCTRFNIPVVKLSPADLVAGRRGICGHVDISQAFRESTHSDPGPSFPWASFLAAVAAAMTSKPSTRKPRREMIIQYGPNGAFRGATTVEQGDTSAVVAQAWLTFGVTYADPTKATAVLCSSLGANGVVLEQKTYKLANNASDFYVPHPMARQITIEGGTQPGAIIAASLVEKPK